MWLQLLSVEVVRAVGPRPALRGSAELVEWLNLQQKLTTVKDTEISYGLRLLN